MTKAEALNLLRLTSSDAARPERIREAHALRRQQLASRKGKSDQLAVKALDEAAYMLLQAAGRPGAKPQHDPAGAGNGRDADWITATPWSAIRADSSEFRSPDEPTAQAPPKAPTRPAPTPPPAPQPETRSIPVRQPGPPAAPSPAPVRAAPPRAQAPVTMNLPESVLDQPGSGVSMTLRDLGLDEPGRPPHLSASAPARPVPAPAAVPGARLRPAVPGDLAPAAGEGPVGPSRWVAAVVALVVIGGVIATAVWGWQAGILDNVLTLRGTERPVQSPGPGRVDPQHTSSGSSGRTDSPPAVPEPELQQQRQEVQALAEELAEVAGQLGAPAGIDVRSELATVDRRLAASEMDEAAQDLARLKDSLRTQIEAGRRTLVARGRLNNAGRLGGSSPLSIAATDYLDQLLQRADTQLEDGDYVSAAGTYERALDARLRLPQGVEALEPQRREAHDQYQRALTVLAEISVTPDAVERLRSPLAGRAASLDGLGPVVQAWLQDEPHAAAQLAEAYDQLAADSRTLSDRLEKFLSLQAFLEARLEQTAEVEAEVASLQHQAERLASMLDMDAAGPRQNAQQASQALTQGKLDEALAFLEAAAGEASTRLDAATRLRDLLGRREQSGKELTEARSASDARLDALEKELTSRAERADPEAQAEWREAAARVAADAKLLRDIAAVNGAVPADAEALQMQVQQIELRADVFAELAAAVEALGLAEQRLVLLRQLSTTAGVDAGEEAAVPSPAATEARRQLEQLGDPRRDLSAQGASSVRRLVEQAAEGTMASAATLAEPAGATLGEMLAARQEGFSERFGEVDLHKVWQPQEIMGAGKAPADLAPAVGQAMEARVTAEELQNDLRQGDGALAQQVLAHIDTLDQVTASLTMLREAAERENEQGLRPLHRAAAAGDVDQVSGLLTLKVSAAPRDADSRTPLGLALAGGHSEVARLLLDAGGHPPGWVEGGRPIVFLAVASPESLRLLLRHGAPVRDLHRGETVLHALAWQANREQVPAKRQLESAAVLLEAGVDAGARNRSGQTASELAASLGLRDLASYLRGRE